MACSLIKPCFQRYRMVSLTIAQRFILMISDGLDAPQTHHAASSLS
ncbi:hypothetical protein [Neisseria zoodegmatis]|nr:hypothetical protein [Neisseria zoodegmatis]